MSGKPFLDDAHAIFQFLVKELTKETGMLVANANTLRDRIIVPPIKCQGIKTKIVPYIKQLVRRDPDGLWIEPFVGTGSVPFNVRPNRAVLTDKNQYIIAFYQAIQQGSIDGKLVRDFLEYHGEMLRRDGKEYYLQMRSDFNMNGDPLYFLFLNRSDFNGMIRFNKKGEFNVPFCQKPNRFAKAYLTDPRARPWVSQLYMCF